MWTGLRATGRGPWGPLALGLFITSAGCASGGGGGAAAGSDPESPVDEDTVAATVDENIATVVHVVWSTPAATSGYVEFGPDTEYGQRTPITADAREHGVTLLGLKPAALWHYRVVTDVGGVAAAGEDHTVETDLLPASLPAFAVERYGSAVWGQYLLVVWSDPDIPATATLILDRDGDVVWYHQPAAGTCMSARFSLDGTAVTMLVERTPTADARLVTIPLDGGAVEETVVAGAHHDFREIGPDAFAYIADEIRTYDGVSVRGDRLIEVGPDGEREVWNAFDDLPVVQNDGWDLSPADWTHANGIDWDPDTGLYLFSMHRLRQVLAIRQDDGGIEWTLGGDGDFRFVDDGGFGPQHAPSWIPGGILLFDNASESPSSRLVQYALDPAARTATRTWSWEAPEGALAWVQGDADRLPDDATVSGWGDLGEVLTLDADGGLVRRVAFERGMVGKVQKTEDLYGGDGS